MVSRPTVWADDILNFQMSANTSASLVDLRGALTDTDRFTLIRLIVRLCVLPANGDTVESGQNQLAIGVGVTSAEAFAAGVVPDPKTEADYPRLGWLWRDILPYFRVRDNTNSLLESHYPEARVDIRAARKIDRGVPFMAFDSSVVQGFASGGAVRVSGLVRALYKQ